MVDTSTVPEAIPLADCNEPNPPVWPPSVKVFRDSDPMEWIQTELEATQDPYNTTTNNATAEGTFTCDNHFARQRWAVLFAPGIYRHVSVQIGYYVQLAGLGIDADQVQFVGGKGPYVPALNKHLYAPPFSDGIAESASEKNKHLRQPSVGTSLDSFWRSAENFKTHQDLLWATSQAAPLRRVRICGDLYLHDGPAYASGGHLANVCVQPRHRVDDSSTCSERKNGGGTIYAGGQQQYLLRHVQADRVTGGAWSLVAVGDSTLRHDCPKKAVSTNNGSSVCGTAKVTVIPEPRVRIEKPYLVLKDDGVWELRIPQAHWKGEASYRTEPMLCGSDSDDIRDFTRVRVVHDHEPSSRIQEALDQGKDVILAPGIFALERSLVVSHAHQVLMGLGFATLEAPPDGSPCIRVAPHVPGIRIVSVMLEATASTAVGSTASSSALLEWGTEGVTDPGCREQPGAMFDVFVRVGGATGSGQRSRIAVPAMMRIHSGHVIGDNLWLWRADHAMLSPNEAANYPHISAIFWQCEQDECQALTGLEVFGDDVTIYGLAVEHANSHQTVWSGERGAVHFYQCEFPYDVSCDFAEQGYRGYLVKEHVTEHEAYAPGIYSNFRNCNVMVHTAIEYPERPGVKVVHPFTVKLDNQGGILSIANGKGTETSKKGLPTFLD
jgi:hypothetical protein